VALSMLGFLWLYRSLYPYSKYFTELDGRKSDIFALVLYEIRISPKIPTNSLNPSCCLHPVPYYSDHLSSGFWEFLGPGEREQLDRRFHRPCQCEI
jgi:hypothetical protein